MILRAHCPLEKLDLCEWVALFFKKTTEYSELAECESGNAMRLRDLKLEIENLYCIIAYQKPVN